MADITPQLSFEHMLAHMFPGFFAALSVFMILDIYSPFHLTQYVSNDVTTLISFYGILLLGGTIIGVIIDGIHHRIIEQVYFQFLEKYIGDKGIRSEDIWNYQKAVKNCPDKVNSWLLSVPTPDDLSTDSICDKCKFDVNEIRDTTKIYFLFDVADLDKCIALREYLTKSVYHYSEFYANTFIALIPFTLVTPIYLVKILHVDLNVAFWGGVLLAVLTVACLDFAWIAYKRWISALYFAFSRCQKDHLVSQCVAGKKSNVL